MRSRVDQETVAARVSEYTLRRRVQFYELDSAGIVHFSTYFRYMEEAEHAMWRAAGLSIASRDAGVGFPRVNATCDYHAPLRFEDEFDVHIRIAGISQRSMRYAYLLRRGDVRVASAAVTIVCVQQAPDGSMQAVPIPPAIAARFAVADGDEVAPGAP